VDPAQERQPNQGAFRRLSDFIKKNYPMGRYLAISDGKIIADAGSFEELNSILHNMGHHSAEVLVVQAGVDYPEKVTIFAQDWQQ